MFELKKILYRRNSFSTLAKVIIGFISFITFVLVVNSLIPPPSDFVQLKYETIENVKMTYKVRNNDFAQSKKIISDDYLTKSQIIEFVKIKNQFSKERVNRTGFYYDRDVDLNFNLKNGKKLMIKCRYGIGSNSKSWTDIRVNGSKSYISYEMRKFIENIVK